MKLRIGEDEYKIQFEYKKRASYLTTGQSRMTTCTILKNDAPIYLGDALCSERDNFSKEIGRKLSLTRALQPLPKGVRELFWDAYRNRFPTADRANASSRNASNDIAEERQFKSRSV